MAEQRKQSAPHGIPAARELISKVIADIEQRAAPSQLKDAAVSNLRAALKMMWRNVEKAPSKRVSRRMDGPLVTAIIMHVVSNAKTSNKEIAEKFNVQAGRVTEVRQGKYNHMLTKEFREAWERSSVEDLQMNFDALRRVA